MERNRLACFEQLVVGGGMVGRTKGPSISQSVARCDV